MDGLYVRASPARPPPLEESPTHLFARNSSITCGNNGFACACGDIQDPTTITRSKLETGAYDLSWHPLGPLPGREKINYVEMNRWNKCGQWGPYPTPHFHTNTHECYAVLAGLGTFILGKSPIDADTDEHDWTLGIKVHLEEGDAIVFLDIIPFSEKSDTDDPSLWY